MNKKLLGALMITFGVFLFAGAASASTADFLQPASDVVYDENLIVNATGIFDSVRVGKQDVGGVTFFNGTIINETTDSGGGSVPVTFGDDVRVDGAIWRGVSSGPDNMPVKIKDDLYVENESELAGGAKVDTYFRLPVYETLPVEHCNDADDNGKLIMYLIPGVTSRSTPFVCAYNDAVGTGLDWYEMEPTGF